jgi:hypothetical protein
MYRIIEEGCFKKYIHSGSTDCSGTLYNTTRRLWIMKVKANSPPILFLEIPPRIKDPPWAFT